MIMIIRTGNSGTRQARASKLAPEMSRLSGSALISGHLGHSRHLFSAGSNVPLCLLCSESSRMAKLASLARGVSIILPELAWISRWLQSENMAGFVVDSFS